MIYGAGASLIAYWIAFNTGIYTAPLLRGSFLPLYVISLLYFSVMFTKLIMRLWKHTIAKHKYTVSLQ